MKADIEGLYVVEFGDAIAGSPVKNAGVVVIEAQRFFGGDSFYYYVGTYQLSNDKIIADGEIVRHNAGSSIWGDFDKLNLTFDGVVSDDQTICGSIHLDEDSKPFKMSYKHGLPPRSSR